MRHFERRQLQRYMKLRSMVYAILVFAGGVLFGQSILGRRQKENFLEMQCLAEKHLEMFFLMDRWLKNKQDRKRIGEYLKKQGYQNVTIYGAGYVGKRLYAELSGEGFEVVQLVDRNGGMKCFGVKVKQFSEKMKPTDAVIVTAVYSFEEIEEGLRLKFGCAVLSLWDIVYRM